jgi:hypothetical protein
MKNKAVTIIFKLLLIILGFSSLGFQLVYFVFSSLNRRSNDVRSRVFTDTIPHFFTLIICGWFIVYQIRTLVALKEKE